MSDEQKDAVIGRVARERAEAKKHMAALRSEATRIGQRLSEMGRQLVTGPELVVFEREPVNAIYSNPRLNIPPYTKADVDNVVILKLTNDIRDTLDKLKDLDRQAADLGIA